VSAKHLVVGLDGADWVLVDRIGAARLPTLARLRREGAWARLRSVPPYATLPNWSTFLTGLDPGQHGVFDFTTRRGTRVAFTAGTVREAPTIAARLDRLGLRVACLGFPGTWPPERLSHGLFVSGWDSPVAFEADRSFVWPPAEHAALVRRFGPLLFDDVDELLAEQPGWHAGLGARLEERIERRTAMGAALLAERPWDLFALYFGESDTASHHLHAHFDPSSPRHPPDATALERDGLPRVYAALDRALARLLAAAGPGVELTVLSDHGSTARSDVVVHLNRSLAEAGLAAFRPSRPLAALTRLARGPLLGALPPRARDRLFRAFGRALPGWLESRARFAALDLPRTRVFSDELNYFPALHLNLRGREPEGTVGEEDLPGLERDLEAWRRSLRDPLTGRPIVEAIVPREEAFSGPFVARAPDYLLELARPDERAYAVMPASGPGPAVERLDPSEHLGRKGRSLPGAHRPRGLLALHGPSVRPGEIDARMVDTTPTLLARMGIEPPLDFPGRVLREALAQAEDGARRLPAVEVARAPGADASATEARLRALGYVE
jgi:predicted AlkP superfamily phosphohydrolase/phosphomutase